MIKTIKISAKCRDAFTMDLINDNKEVFSYLGYVPNKLIPGKYGDSIDLEIDVESGKIINWTKPTQNDFEEFIKEIEL